MVQELTQDQVDQIFPTGSDDDLFGSQQSILELEVGLCTCFYMIRYKCKALLIDYMLPNVT